MATVLRFDEEDWTVTHFESEYANLFGVRRANAVFFDRRHAFMNGRRGFNRDTVI